MQTDVDNGISENPTGDNGVETTDGKPRKRKPYRPGIGGFLVRSRNRFINKQKSIPDEGNGDKSVGETAKKPARKKKSKISDNYPQYIQDAFFGSLAQEQKPNPVPTLPTVKMERDASPKFDPSDYLIKPEQVVEPQVRPSTATAPDMKSEAGDVSGCESSLTDEYISIIDLDDDLPQRPESEEEEDITDINFFNFDVVEGDLKEQGVDVSDIFRELEDDGDSEEEEKEESLPSIKSEPGIVVKNEAPPTQPPQPPPPQPPTHLQNAQMNRVVSQGLNQQVLNHQQVIYNQNQSQGQLSLSGGQVVQVAHPGMSNSPHLSPQIQVQQVIPNDPNAMRN